ncbi:MAG TPA: hypothetical protein VEL07_01355 [Planctomycetota bacterium]|nr:hypothetical protein [Planctomycetota bacterium]
MVTSSLTTPLRADARPSQPIRTSQPRPPRSKRLIYSEDGSLRRAMRLRRGFHAIGMLLGSPLSEELVHALVTLVVSGVAPEEPGGGCEAHRGVAR